MASKRGDMRAVLEQQAKGQQPEAIMPTKERKVEKQPSRAGKVNVTGYFPPAVKSSFRMIQTAHPEKTIQDLLAEAINDLFAKYNVPQTAQLEK
jgi:antitoxin-like ribbon-helix-helix protein